MLDNLIMGRLECACLLMAKTKIDRQRIALENCHRFCSQARGDWCMKRYGSSGIVSLSSMSMCASIGFRSWLSKYVFAACEHFSM